MQREESILKDGEGLLQMLSSGIRDGHPLYYTYVLLEDRWMFSETGADFLRDMMSKHAMHASCSEMVRGMPCSVGKAR